MKKKPTKCAECHSYKEQNNMGFCSKFQWKIIPSLVKRQAVCSEDDELAEEIGLVTVLSPCGHLSYITRKSYEESKEKPDSDKVNFWRSLK